MNRFLFVNVLTFVRAPLVLVGSALALVHLAHPHPATLAAAVAFLCLSAITDLFDGKLARKWGVTSRFGALADPLMDKVFYLFTLPTATFIALYNEDVVHASVLLALDIVSLVRDQWASFLRSVGSEFHADMRASFSGKLRTFLAFPVITFVQIHLGLQTLALRSPVYEGVPLAPAPIVYVIELALLALTIASGIDYTVRFWPYLRKAAHPGS